MHHEPSSVSLALNSVLVGSRADFHVLELSERHFRFSVASKSVGFMVLALKCIIASTFDVYFHLWSNGGPNWEREYQLWLEEEQQNWTVVSHFRRKHVSFAPSVLPRSSP